MLAVIALTSAGLRSELFLVLDFKKKHSPIILMETSCHELFSPHCAAMLKLKFCTVNMAQSGKITSHTKRDVSLYCGKHWC